MRKVKTACVIDCLCFASVFGTFHSLVYRFLAGVTGVCSRSPAHVFDGNTLTSPLRHNFTYRRLVLAYDYLVIKALIFIAAHTPPLSSRTHAHTNIF